MSSVLCTTAVALSRATNFGLHVRTNGKSATMSLDQPATKQLFKARRISFEEMLKLLEDGS